MASSSKRQSSIKLRIVLLLFAVFMIYYLGSLIKEFSSAESNLNASKAKQNELELKVEELSNLLENGNDQDFIERAAREKLGYVYPDEHKYIDISGDSYHID